MMRFVLNTGRTIPQGSFLERKMSVAYRDEVSCCRVNPVDMMVLGVEEGDRLMLTGRGGGPVVVTVTPDDELPRETLFLPLGPYANHLISGETNGTGMPDFKTTEVTAEPTTLEVLPVAQLMAQCGGVRYAG